MHHNHHCTHHTDRFLRPGHRAAAVLIAAGLTLSAVSACSSDDDATSPSSQASAESSASVSEQEQGTTSAMPSLPGLDATREKMGPSVASMSEQEVQANFPGGTFLNCALGEEFFADSYVDVGYQTVDAQDGDAADGVESRQYCIGFATPEGDQGSAYMEMRTTETTAIDEVTDTDEFETYDNTQISDWKYVVRDNSTGTRVCAVHGPKDTPMERVYLTAIGECSLLEPLVRNLHDLATRYAELTGTATNTSEYVGPGERPRVRLNEARFATETQGVPGMGEVVTADVEQHKGASLAIENARINSDPQGGMGRVCADVTMTDNSDDHWWEPTEDLYVMTGTMLFIKMHAEGGDAPREGRSRTQRYCTEAGVLYANADVAFVLAEPADGERVRATDNITPLWTARISAEGKQLTIE